MKVKNKKWQRPTLLVLTKLKDSTGVLANCKTQSVGPTTPNASAGRCMHTGWGSLVNLCEQEGIPSDCHVECEPGQLAPRCGLSSDPPPWTCNWWYGCYGNCSGLNNS